MMGGNDSDLVPSQVLRGIVYFHCVFPVCISIVYFHSAVQRSHQEKSSPLQIGPSMSRVRTEKTGPSQTQPGPPSLGYPADP